MSSTSSLALEAGGGMLLLLWPALHQMAATITMQGTGARRRIAFSHFQHAKDTETEQHNVGSSHDNVEHDSSMPCALQQVVLNMSRITQNTSY